ncbi:winged helix-turn-helix domain-containing protein [Actinomadura parmotrematis]|uniref:Winged helix-turn-helix domain-containing protein n=1 Tax=Actinomadura parmotrematis TaxID=2864039 RepID=A0ABS7G610_9ACTN|nr:winged helix-turn-helix domain-containing protein [Actinomadura parmotrematis]MBW8487242.1 winged helix-turn-helix domain-containing protein [Actinomadura parmotrematis]
MVKRTGRPGYLQIADDLRGQIEDGTLTPGDALPSIAELVRQYEASTGVVKSAISVLRTEGRVIGQQGKGVFVSDATAGDGNGDAVRTGDEALMKQLTEILGAVRDLGERVARLEQSVFPEPPRAPRPGK